MAESVCPTWNVVSEYSSARMDEIEDVRAVPGGSGYRTYSFTYNADPIPHLTGIANYVGTGENYTFTYSGSYTLNAPFAPYPSYGQTKSLAIVTLNGLNLSHSFTYDALASGELTKVEFPYGGELRWDYRPFTFAGSRSLREVSARYVLKAPGQPLWTYSFWRNDAFDANNNFHYQTVIYDASNVADRVYAFYYDGPAWQRGLLFSFAERETGTSKHARTDSAWTQDALGRAYISYANRILDVAQPSEKILRTEQSLDIYGNVVWKKLYDYYTPPASPVLKRTYNYTYLTGSNYLNRYIRNRVTQVTVTEGAQTITLAQPTYDNYVGGLTHRSGLRQHDSGIYSTSFIYRGNPTSISQYGSIASSIGYDITGMASQQTSGSQIVSITPTANNAVPQVITPNSQPNLSNTLQWSAFLGLQSNTGPNGAVASTTYDIYARPATTTGPHGVTTTYTYDDVARTTRAEVNGRWTLTTHDGFGRPIKAESGTGASTVSIVETEYEPCACSPLGKMKRATLPYAPGGTKYWTTYAYDYLGRTASVTPPDGAGATGYLYEGNTVKVTDPAGKWKKHTMDALGQLTKVTEPNPVGGSDLETLYTYDAAGALTLVSMTRGGTLQQRSFVYNANGFLSSMTNPENGTVTYTYNGNGLPATKTDAKNQRVEYFYDAFQRLEFIDRYPAGAMVPDPCQSVEFTYDYRTIYDVTWGNDWVWGRLTEAKWGSPSCDAAGGEIAEQYIYTRAGLQRYKRIRVVKGGYVGRLNATYDYDNEGRLIYEQYPNDKPVPNESPNLTYDYDAMKRLTGIRHYRPSPPTYTTLASGAAYGPGGQLLGFNYLGYAETRSYNNLQQLRRIQASGSGLLSFDEEYVFSGNQNNGRITQSKDWISGEEVNYQYDSLNRLISAYTTGTQWGVNFIYDGFGNKTGHTAVPGKTSYPPLSILVNPANNRVMGTGVSYDANGNLTAMPGGATFTYDVENRVTANPSGQPYGYGPDNRRVWDGAAYTFWSVTGHRIGRYQPAGQTWDNNPQSDTYLQLVWTFNTLETKLYFGGKLIGEGAAGSGTVYTAVVTDRLGSVRVRGTERYNYYPYGEERGTVTAQGRDKFGTYLRDANGIDYADQRYFASQWGRFLTADPAEPGRLAEPGSWNLYSYVVGDPINFNDPNGLDYRDLRLNRGPFNCSSRLIEWINTLSSPVPEVRREIAKWKSSPVEFLRTSDAGMLATHVFLEWQGDNTYGPNDANIWRALANVWRNRWLLPNNLKRDWGFSTGGFKSLFTQYSHAENFWKRNADLKPIYQSIIKSRLKSNSESDECVGFLNAMQIGYEVWATPGGGDPGDATRLALWYTSAVGTGKSGPPRDVGIPTVSLYDAGSRTVYLPWHTFTFWTPQAFWP